MTIYFIPIYYTISYREYVDSCRIERIDPVFSEETFAEAEHACSQYRAAVETAIREAQKQHISTFKEAHPTFPVYSKTWGK